MGHKVQGGVVNGEALRYLKEMAIDKGVFERSTEHIIEGFLPKGLISLWYADGGVGKSWLLHSVLHRILDSTGMEVVVIDADNPASELKKRGVDRILIGAYERMTFIHRTSMQSDPFSILMRMAEMAVGEAYSDMVLVIDSLKDAAIDLRNDAKMAKIMNALMNIREAGATIIVLHHSNKDGGNYQGSNQIRNSIDVMYRVHPRPSGGGRLRLWTEVQKERASVLDKGWEIDTGELRLSEIDLESVRMSDYEQSIVDRVIKALEKHGELNQRELFAQIGESHENKSARAVLEKFEGRFYTKKVAGKKYLYNIDNTDNIAV